MNNDIERYCDAHNRILEVAPNDVSAAGAIHFADTWGLVSLLIEKGIFTKDEYDRQAADSMEFQLKRMLLGRQPHREPDKG